MALIGVISCGFTKRNYYCIKSQVSFICSFSYRRRIRKYNVLKSVLSKDGVKILKTTPSSNAMKKLNWENEALFGKLVRPTTPCANKSRSPSLLKNVQRLRILELAKGPSINYFLMTLQDRAYEEDLWQDETPPPPVESSLSSFTDYDNGKLLDFPIYNIWRNNNSQNIEVGLDTLGGKNDTSIEGNDISFPSVTRILQATMPPESAEILKKWKEKMIALMGREKFEEYQKRLFSQGAAFHGCVEKHLLKPDTEVTIPHQVEGFWESAKDILPDVTNVQYIEGPVQHPFLHYKGIFDCIANYKGTLSLIEWKTSQKPKTTVKDLYDNPLQVAAYIGAVNFDRRYDVQINQGVIIVVNQSGYPGNVHIFSKSQITSLWKQWLQRLSLYWKINGKRGN